MSHVKTTTFSIRNPSPGWLIQGKTQVAPLHHVRASILIHLPYGSFSLVRQAVNWVKEDILVHLLLPLLDNIVPHDSAIQASY